MSHPSEPDEAEVSRLRKLWLSVILRAKEDAEGQDLMANFEGEELSLRREGRQWLVGDTILRPMNKWDLERVCEWAGVNPEELVRVSRGRYYGTTTL